MSYFRLIFSTMISCFLFFFFLDHHVFNQPPPNTTPLDNTQVEYPPVMLSPILVTESNGVKFAYLTPFTGAPAVRVAVLFHGCAPGRSANDWFQLPEESIVTNDLLSLGFVVVAFQSVRSTEPRKSNECWDAGAVSLIHESLRNFCHLNKLTVLPMIGIAVGEGAQILVQLSQLAPIRAIALWHSLGGLSPNFLPARVPATFLVYNKRGVVDGERAQQVYELLKKLTELHIQETYFEMEPAPLDRYRFFRRIPGVSQTISVEATETLLIAKVINEVGRIIVESEDVWAQTFLGAKPPVRTFFQENVEAVMQQLGVLAASGEHFSSEAWPEVKEFLLLRGNES